MLRSRRGQGEVGLSFLEDPAVGRPDVACVPPLSTICLVSPQALEEDLNQKKREQEMFFKLSEEAECSVPTTPSKATKFFPYSSADAS